MTDRTHPEAGSTHIIRYALELGLLWIDGSGRDKVREALNALDALEAKLASIGAGGVQALSAAPAEADMFWDAEDGERFGHDIDDIISYFGPGDRVKINCAKRMPSIEVLVIEDGDDFTYQVISPTPPPAEQPQPRYSRLHDADAVHGKQLSVYSKPPAEQAAPKAAPAQQEWRLVLPGGKYTDKWESARIGDYNRGWNDYRKAAIAALNSVVWPARASGNWVGASTWLRNNYQDYPNITSLCDAMLEAAPQQEAQEPVALHQVYRCKIKSRKQIDKEIPRESQGWWADVAAGQKLLLRQAVQSDLDRCNLGGKRSKDPNDYMCETPTNGSLVSKVALEYMNPEQNVFASTAPQPAPAPLSDDTERLEWLLWKLPGDALRYVVGELSDTSSGAEFRAAIDAALAAHGGK